MDEVIFYNGQGPPRQQPWWYERLPESIALERVLHQYENACNREALGLATIKASSAFKPTISELEGIVLHKWQARLKDWLKTTAEWGPEAREHVQAYAKRVRGQRNLVAGG